MRRSTRTLAALLLLCPGALLALLPAVPAAAQSAPPPDAVEAPETAPADGRAPDAVPGEPSAVTPPAEGDSAPESTTAQSPADGLADEAPPPPIDATAAKNRALTFTRLVLAGRMDDARAMGDEALAAGLTDELGAKLRETLAGQLGELVELGEPWIAGEDAGHASVQVPARYTLGLIDYRVVLAKRSGLPIAGFRPTPHAERAEAPLPEGLSEAEATVGAGGSALGGTLTLPAGDGPFPGVVLVHGSGPQDRDETLGPNRPFRDLAWGLASRGIAVLRYDKCTKVACRSIETVDDEVVVDARLALGVLGERPEVDSGRLYLLGHSLGGTLAPRIARGLEGEPAVAGLVVLAGATRPLYELALEQTEYVLALDGELPAAVEAQLETMAEEAEAVREVLAGGIETGGDAEGGTEDGAEASAGETEQPVYLGAPLTYWRDLEGYEPAVVARELDLPILVLQGERDYQVVEADLAGWRRALGEAERACIVSYPELDHLFRTGTGPSTPADYQRPGEVEPEVIEDVAEWILERECPAVGG